jgi:hypothetical protein
MKLSIVSDKNGKIVSISRFGDVGEKVSGITKAGVAVEPGHIVHEVDLPHELEKANLLDLHTGFKIDLSHGPGKLVKA